jgi:hypothetical protein
VRGLRFDLEGQNSGDDFWWGLAVAGVSPSGKQPYNIVLDHNSVSGSYDDQVAMQGTDSTVSWNVLYAPGRHKQNYIQDGGQRVTIHHNFFAGPSNRNPLIATAGDGLTVNPVPHISADIRNNLIQHGIERYGTYIWNGAKANVMNNFYFGMVGIENYGPGMRDAIVICGSSKECPFPNASTGRAGGAWLSGNVARPAYYADPNVYSLYATAPYSAPPITETDAETAACHVLSQAGVNPKDPHYEPYLYAARTDLSKFISCDPIAP